MTVGAIQGQIVRPEGHARPTTAACGILSILGVLAVIGTAVAASRHAISWKATIGVAAGTAVCAATTLVSSRQPATVKRPPDHISKPIDARQYLIDRGIAPTTVVKRIEYFPDRLTLGGPLDTLGGDRTYMTDWSRLLSELTGNFTIRIRRFGEDSYSTFTRVDEDTVIATDSSGGLVSMGGSHALEVLFIQKPAAGEPPQRPAAAEPSFLMRPTHGNQPKTAQEAITVALAAQRRVFAVSYRPVGTEYVELFNQQGLAGGVTMDQWAEVLERIQGHLNAKAMVLMRIAGRPCFQVTSIDAKSLSTQWSNGNQVVSTDQAMVFIVMYEPGA